MAVKRGQAVVAADAFPLLCLTIELDHAALPVDEVWFQDTKTKDTWIAKVGSFDSTHPNVLTAMQGDHRSLTMLIVRLPPGRYELYRFEFEGRRRSHFVMFTRKGESFFLEVKPGCANFVGSLVIAADWDLISNGGGSLPASMTAESTAQRDRKWAGDIIPGMITVQSEESAIETVHETEPASPNLGGSSER